MNRPLAILRSASMVDVMAVGLWVVVTLCLVFA